MTTDKTPATLATVKHGGCVQLGASERARFDAFLRDNPFMALMAGTAWQVWQAALSAQPSPGGELPPLPDFGINTANHASVRIRGFTAEQMLDYARAARQPVSETDAYQQGFRDGQDRTCTVVARQPVGGAPNFAACCAEGGGSISGCSCVNPNHVFLASQASLAAEERAHGETIDQRDRCEEVADELAGHIARITGVDIGEHSSANCPWQNAIEAAEEYKPAQAVDLADFKALYRAYVRLLESGRDRIRDLGGACDPVDVMEANDVDLQAARRVIDSKAVGNG